ncbi:hypothetical protein CKM354_000148300 [Cercospora kikuchii]|uniref:Vacuolar protein sorting-associated protein 62 n=1 Tax=Cercospora kikuchii TaxID=84275 RepID=A0A9P3FBY2_9PEZI|nr:uncharacterized protein CKM354_000148300 [Cercospora kikuchii]GIZ38057.1 hypothetical protein CKM354_000148300 [Cercospora kikuchii]
MLVSILITAGAAAAVPLERRQSSIPSSVPSFVAEFAPIFRLHSAELYMPSDISTHIANTSPYLNRTSLSPTSYPNTLTLSNLDQLNTIPNSNSGKDIYLTSTSDPTTSPRPAYLYGTSPDPVTHSTPNTTASTIITVLKPNSTLDAFYFTFYSFNDGGRYPSFAPILNIGNHVGDWEHIMIRFIHGVPISVYFSQHSSGQALSYEAAEKWENTGRVVAYVANGTHANYEDAGDHDHTIPGIDLPEGPVEDYTDDKGLVWDPILDAYWFEYEMESGKFTAYDDGEGGETPVNWLYFDGKWGDMKYPEDDERQECFLGIDGLCQYSGGPTGPKDKDLGRKGVCPDGEDVCEALGGI